MLWHVGTGKDGAMEWDRYRLIVERLEALNLASDVRDIEDEARAEVDALWQERLRIRSGN